MILLSIISVRVSDDVKRKMRRFKNVNWAEYIRRAIEKKIREEEMKIACLIMDSLAEKTSGRWSGVDEIRKWRERRGRRK